MKKRLITAVLALVIVISLIPAAFAAQKKADEVVKVDWLNHTAFKYAYVTPHEYLGEVEIGGLWLGDEPSDFSFSVFVVDDSVEAFVVECYTTDRKTDIYSCESIGGVLTLGYYDSETGTQVDDGKVHQLQMNAGDIVDVTENQPIEFWFLADNEGWQPLSLIAPLYGEGEDDNFGEYLGWISYSAIVLTKSQVTEFKKRGTLAPMISSSGEDLSSYADLSQLKTLLKNAPVQEQDNSVPQLTVRPTPSTVFINGTAIEFEAYLINGNNYFKLRDLAMVLSGTEKQFEVGYNESTGAITLTSGKAYTPSGVELVKGDGSAKSATLNKNIKISKDDKAVEITAYLINDNNFVKLRDVMSLFDVGVTYDEQTRNIGIDTSIGYTG